VEYQPRKGAFGAPKGKVTPPAWFKGVPKLTEDDDITRRATAVDSYKTLASIMDKSLMDKGNKSIDVAVAEMVQSLQQAQSVTDPKKRFTVKAFTQWRYPLLCYAALDDIGTLFEMFTQNDTPFFVRGLCMMTFQQWLAQGRENDYALLDVVRKSNIKKTPSIKIMERFHMVTSEEAEKASTYQQLIEDLNNDLMPIRALSHWHLVGLVPQGQAIPYDPAMPRELRDAAVRSWSRLIPPGTVPSTGAPKGPPMKKDKGQP
jgi:hypothetical protein